MSVQTLMNTTVDIKIEYTSKDQYGNNTTSLVLSSAGLPARVVNQQLQRALELYGKYDATTMKVVCFASNPNIIPVKDWITVDGIDFNVTSIRNAGGELNRFWQVDVLRKPF